MKPTRPLREHHDHLMLKIQDFEKTLTELSHLSPPELERVLQEQIGFLQNDVKSHAAAEEAFLYPEINNLTGGAGFKTSGTMEIDHEYIAGYIGRLAELTVAMTSPKIREFQRLGWELAAILKLHFDKEERLYFPFLDSQLTEKEVQKRIVEKMDLFEEAKWTG